MRDRCWLRSVKTVITVGLVSYIGGRWESALNLHGEAEFGQLSWNCQRLAGVLLETMQAMTNRVVVAEDLCGGVRGRARTVQPRFKRIQQKVAFGLGHRIEASEHVGSDSSGDLRRGHGRDGEGVALEHRDERLGRNRPSHGDAG